MQHDDIAELAKGMVPFVRDVVAESNVIPPELALRMKAAVEMLAEPQEPPPELPVYSGGNPEPVRSVRGTIVTRSGELAVVYSDGSSERLCNVIGPQGPQGERGLQGERGADGVGIKGDDGAPGRNGASIEAIAYNRGGELMLTLSDGRVLTPHGRVVPAKK